jgi:hypothetical protein
MPYFNYNNAKISITGQAFMAESVGISMENALSPSFLLNRRSSENYIPEDGMRGSLSLRYYLTGVDPLKNFLKNEKDVISINFNGLEIKSGYLTSYGFEASPFSPVIVDADITFYDTLVGSFLPLKETNEPPNFVTFKSLSFDVTGADLNDNTISFSYKYDSTIEPLYTVGQTTPKEVRFLEKSQNLSVKAYDLGNIFSHTGKFITANVSIGTESYDIKGILTSKETSASFGDKIISSLEITQSTYGNKPIVKDVSPSSVAWGNEILISGSNLDTTTAVLFKHNLYSTKITHFGENIIKVKVPKFARSGSFTVINLAGETRVPEDSRSQAGGFSDGIKIT